jgi:hypothetical protein
VLGGEAKREEEEGKEKAGDFCYSAVAKSKALLSAEGAKCNSPG